MDTLLTIIMTLVVAAVPAYIGYYRGQLATIREKKLELYQKALPWLVNAALDNVKYPKEHTQRHFNSNVRKIWIFGNKQVALAVDNLCSILVHPDKGDKIECLQDIISSMRKDIQIGLCQSIDSEEIKHIHMIFDKTEIDKDGCFENEKS